MPTTAQSRLRLLRDRRANEPGCIQIADDEHKHVNRPDAQSAAAIEVAEVARLVAGLEQDRGDEKSRKNKKKIYTGPSPERGVVDPCSCEARVAVIEEDEEDGEAA